jgi:hypothetical protein
MIKIVRELTRTIDSVEMQIAKIIVALLVSFSVAIVPFAGGAAMLTQRALAASTSQPTSVDASGMASDPMAMDQPMHDGCPHKRAPCDQGKNCASTLMCAIHCFNFTAVEGAEIVFPLTVAGKILPFTERAGPSAIDAPPFRPPRI